MKRTMKAALVATAMSAVALVPVAGVVTAVTADAAYAKGGNGNGGGNGGGGNGNAGESRGGGNDKSARGGGGGGKPSWAGGGGRSGSSAQRGGPDPVGDFFRKVTGQDRKQARQAARSAPARSAPETSVQPASRPDTKLPGSRAAQLTGLHPSALGNMNGALNANINAVIAHMESGNFEGPVGHMAAIALASASATEAEAFLDSPEGMEYSAYSAALEASGYASYEDYLKAVDTEGAEVNEALESAHAALGTANLQQALGDYESYAAYLEAKDSDSTLEDPAIEEAYAAMGSIDPALLELHAGAVEDTASLSDAQTALLDYWNKNDPGSVEDDEKLLAGVMAHIEENSDVISETAELLEADADAEATTEAVEEDAADCADPETCTPIEDASTLASAD